MNCECGDRAGTDDQRRNHKGERCREFHQLRSGKGASNKSKNRGDAPAPAGVLSTGQTRISTEPGNRQCEDRGCKVWQPYLADDRIPVPHGGRRDSDDAVDREILVGQKCRQTRKKQQRSLNNERPWGLRHGNSSTEYSPCEETKEGRK